METNINSNIIITNPSPELLAWSKDNLVVANPEYTQMKIMGKENLIKYKHIPEKLYLYAKQGNAYIFPFGLLNAFWSQIKTSKYDFKFNSTPDISIKNDKPVLEPYDYQEKAINAMVEAKGGVLVSPAGSGKTSMGIEIIRRIGKRTLWLCHTGDLLRQARDDMKAQYPNIKIGLTTDGKLDIGEDVTISTIQTLSRLDPDLYKNEFEVVICDEAVHVASSITKMNQFVKVLSKIPARYKYGLTATPSRADKLIKCMYAYLGTSHNGLFEPTYKVDRSEVKTIEAEHVRFDIDSGYNENMYDTQMYDTSGMINYTGLISELSDNSLRTDKIIQNIKKCCAEGRKQVVLTLRVEHCEEIVEKLNKQGINAVLCVGKVTAKRREEILKQKVKWDVLVATYSLLKEGVSIKELDTLHMVTPIKEKGMVCQCAGRIERYLEGKKQPIVYDYVDVDIPYCVRAYDERRKALKRRF